LQAIVQTTRHILPPFHLDIGKKNGEVFLDKRFTDLLTPDIDALQGFLFEQAVHGDTPIAQCPIRISAKNGHVAYMMPAIIRS